MTEFQQKILNDMLRRQEKALFLQDTNNKESYNIVGNIMELLLAGAKPSDYNIYGRIIRVAEEMHENLMSPFFNARDEFINYIKSIIEGESKTLVNVSYIVLKDKVSKSLLQEV